MESLPDSGSEQQIQPTVVDAITAADIDEQTCKIGKIEKDGEIHKRVPARLPIQTGKLHYLNAVAGVEIKTITSLGNGKYHIETKFGTQYELTGSVRVPIEEPAPTLASRFKKKLGGILGWES